MDKIIKVYGVVEGPFSTHDIPDWEEEHGWLLVCQVEQLNGSLDVEEVVFDTFDEAYEITRWFKSQCVPFEMTGYV